MINHFYGKSKDKLFMDKITGVCWQIKVLHYFEILICLINPETLYLQLSHFMLT